MTPAAIRKAALLLMGVDNRTAAELLKALEPEAVTQIAAELAYLQASGDTGRDSIEQPVREFVEQLQESAGGGTGRRSVRAMVEDALGPEKSREALKRIPELIARRDPFFAIRSAEPEAIAAALAGESPHVAGLVLAELPRKTSAKLLALLGEEVRAEAIRDMTREESASPETRAHVASTVRKKIQDAEAPGGGANREEQLRKVAVLLRELGSELRGALVEAISEADEETSLQVQQLMVMWEDVKAVADRSLQDGLRSIDVRKLALALSDADEVTTRKIRGNMSERQTAMLDEEAGLLSSPRADEIEQARGEFLEALRELAGNGMLAFEEG